MTGVSHVFNFEIPNVPEQYVHRIGRTARAGADGVAISFCAPDEKPYMRDIERLTKVKPDIMALPENFLVEAARLPAPSRKPEEQENDARREARDARGRGGQRGAGGPGGNRGGGNGGGRNGERSHGGKAQGRDGRPRDANPRNAASARPGDRERGPVGNPIHGDRAPQRDARATEGDGGQRPFRSRGAPGVGQHRNKVQRVS